MELTERDKELLGILCKLQEEHLEHLNKKIGETDFSAKISGALERNMDILREVACKLSKGLTPDEKYIMEMYHKVREFLADAGIVSGKPKECLFPWNKKNIVEGINTGIYSIEREIEEFKESLKESTYETTKKILIEGIEMYKKDLEKLKNLINFVENIPDCGW